MTDALSLNRYLYCANDPVNFIDPSGMKNGAVRNFLKNTGNAIKNTVTTAVSNTVQKISNGISSAVEKVKDIFTPNATTTPPSSGVGVGAGVITGTGGSTSGGGSWGGRQSDPIPQSTQTPSNYSYPQNPTVEDLVKATDCGKRGTILNASLKTVGGLILTGIAAVVGVAVATTAALPVALVAAAGAVAVMAYGSSTFAEGVNGLLNGSSYNPLRDTVFKGNQAAYDVSGFLGVVAIGGAATAPIIEEIITKNSEKVEASVSNAKEFSNEQIKKYALNATQGSSESNKIVLGKYVEGSESSYDSVAKAINAQYFNLENWDTLSSQYSKEEIWKINEQFISNAINEGKEVFLSHNPADYLGDGSYYSKEIQTLIDRGFSFVQEGGLWRATR